MQKFDDGRNRRFTEDSSSILTHDIHYGKPTVLVALKRLDEVLKRAKNTNEKIIEVVVGYGSRSGSHLIKTATIEKLNECKDKKYIKDFICGGDIDIFNPVYQNFKYRELIPKVEHVKRNRGSIFVVI